MVKEPRPGRVKTRLGRDMGMVPAAWWFRHQSARLIRRLGTDPRWETVLAVSPDFAGLNSRVWTDNVARVPQGTGNLGARMARLLRDNRAGPTLVIGADIPHIKLSHIQNALYALGSHHVVFGASLDGGYWLVGVKSGFALPPGMFGGVRWSTEFALEDTVATLPGCRIAMINQLQDVDIAADLKSVFD